MSHNLGSAGKLCFYKVTSPAERWSVAEGCLYLLLLFGEAKEASEKAKHVIKERTSVAGSIQQSVTSQSRMVAHCSEEGTTDLLSPNISERGKKSCFMFSLSWSEVEHLVVKY